MEPIVQKDAVANNGSRPISAHSSLPLNYSLAGTYRFGEYGVCYVQDTVPDDDVRFGSSHTLRSFNLGSPLLSDISMFKEYFDVPLTVLLPLNYEKLFVQPQTGEDIDASEIGLTVEDFTTKLRSYFVSSDLPVLFEEASGNYAEFGEDFVDNIGSFDRALKLLFAAERIYSKGSLAASLGISLWPLWKDLDMYIDTVLSEFLKGIKVLEETYSEGLPVIVGYDSNNDPIISYVTSSNFREFIVWARDNYFSFDSGYAEGEQFDTMTDDVFDMFNDFCGVIYQKFDDTLPGYWQSAPYHTATPISLAKLFAYQMVCAEFFTNSHVDDVFTSQLWMQNYSSLLHNDMNISFDTFSWNGIQYQYDVFSAHYTKKAIATSVQIENFCDWTRLVFGFNRSLRFMDYFVASRTRPLAVGDVNVSAAGGYVNVVDTIQKRWYAKFLNQTNRVERKLSDYARALFPGLKMSRDFHNPFWLAQTKDNISAPEIQNTGSEQFDQANSTTAVLRSSGGRYQFEYHSEYYGILIGIQYFDIKRSYAGCIERTNNYIDRNDYFNPYLQFIGDQPIYGSELWAMNGTSIFGYTGRNNELKYRVDQCFGGFIDDLPGWLFKSDDSIYGRFKPATHQGSDFIRSWSTELDKFFPSLTGYSLKDYFHFIVINYNGADNDRPMIANPQLD